MSVGHVKQTSALSDDVHLQRFLLKIADAAHRVVEIHRLYGFQKRKVAGNTDDCPALDVFL
ncbi:MAG: hypothetical protein II485_01290, partial [Firmicutes bacterium]|nr:hypothetical protein [Bacillota bacterium]